ncbi:unnamed protein product [Candida verbasci]|uniref:Uncharacterized protein n=1 Tax=Candida verbasci TaxID=1227364 RepID=A0A9W4TXD9_9ASCO|nr:unnamed protein product [Candida verbasci]
MLFTYQFLILFFTILSTSFAKLYPIQLYVDSNNKTIDDHGLQTYQETNNVYWFFLNNQQARRLIYDDNTRRIYWQDNSQRRFFFKLSNNVLLTSPGDGTRIYIDYKTYRLSFNQDNRLYAVKNVGDPQNISRTRYAIKYYATNNQVPRDAIKINYLYAKFI